MAILTTKSFFLTIKSNQLERLLKMIFEKSLPIEFLNPDELGSTWNVAEYINIDVSKESNDLESLAKIFKLYPQKGFWANFEDTRTQINSTQVDAVLTSKTELLYLADRIVVLNILQNSIARILKNKTLNRKTETELKNSREKLAEIKTEIGLSEKQIKNIVIPELRVLYSAIEQQKYQKEISKYIFKTSKEHSTYFGFIAFASSNEGQISSFLDSMHITHSVIHWNKELVIWKEDKLESFKQIPQSLGTINSKEVDPTKIISFFFAFFFALAINDALYGVIIAGFTGYVLYFKRIKPELKNTFGLLFISGLFSLVVGALTGSWAGNLFSETPINNLLRPFQIIKQIPGEHDSHLPIINDYLNKNLGGASPVVAMLVFAVLVGIVHIFTALTLKAINAYKSNHPHHFITEVSWIVFLASGFGYALTINLPIKPIFAITAAVSILLVFIYNSGKGVLGKMTHGLIQLYELVAFLADVLSYTRLIAIGLTGAIIADVINLLAGLVYTSNPNLIGALFFIVVLVIGHSFNLIVGLFGAYINPLRLHYVEFLPKFYKGKARQLKTIDNSLTYSTLKANA